MAEHVEGDFNQFVFKMAKLEDYPRIFTHLRKVFYTTEPICKASGFAEPEYDEWDNIVMGLLGRNNDLSFYVEESATGKIAGVRLTYKCSHDEPTPNFECTSQKIKNVLGFMTTLNGSSKIYEKFNVDYYADFLMTSVDPEFQRQGLVTEIYRRSINLLRAKGFPLCKSVFTSPFTRKAASNLQFKEIVRLRFSEYRNEDGELILPEATGPEMFAAVMALVL